MGKQRISDGNRCLQCKHYYNINAFTCRAFLDIPDEILSGKNDHSKPLSNQDNSIIFESKTKNKR